MGLWKKLGKLVSRAPSEEELETKVEPKEKPAKIEEKDGMKRNE